MTDHEAITIAALYIDPRGPYPKIPCVDCWDETRDARAYAGPHAIVAHPPCKHWGRLQHLAKVSCRSCGWSGRAHDLDCDVPGEDEPGCPMCGDEPDYGDRDCAPRAVGQARQYGGVLEHPAGSKLWETCGLPFPIHAPAFGEPLFGNVKAYGPRGREDSFGGYTIELDQCEWGHVARKRTWLYLVRVPREALEAPPYPGREPSHWVSGDMKDPARPAHIKICSAQQRRRTPPLFAEYLVHLARSVRL